MKQVLLFLYERDIQLLHNEIAAYTSEDLLWKLHPGINNCSGNLALHLCGNLNHFFGATLGNTGYTRQRDLEFSTKNVPQAELLTSIAAVKAVVQQVLQELPEESLNEKFPLEPFGYPMTTGHMLMHLSTHLNYHLGQINYHRRILS